MMLEFAERSFKGVVMLMMHALVVATASLMIPCGEAAGRSGATFDAAHDDETPLAPSIPHDAEGAAIEGRISTAGGGRLPTVIAYLESTEPGRRYPVPSERPVIRQKGAKFRPSLLVICVGQTVEFPNDEDRPIQHNVFSKSMAESFDLGLYRPGDSKSVTFDEPGVVRLHCSIHKNMDGVIFVCPTPYFARVSADGSFRIENVPAGEYELKTWQVKRRYLDRPQTISVAGDEIVRVQVELHRK